MQFSDNQRRAIQHIAGPAMVLAGPGSGKTTVLTERIKYMIEEKGIPAEQILVITFTRAAAEEMKARFLKKSKGDVTFGTFHSVFYAILRERFHYTAENIIRERDQRRLLLTVMEDCGLVLSPDAAFIDQILGEISRYKSFLFTEKKGTRGKKRRGFLSRLRGKGEKAEPFRSVYMKQDDFLTLYTAYQREMTGRRWLDFDDILLDCYRLLSEDPAVREELQERYRYILVDEFQDVSPIQYDTVKLLAERYQNLFIVGDDDQSIYSFRGADPRIMLGFPEDYPSAVRIDLNENYRSRPEIVQYAGNLIRHNKARYQKKIRTTKEKGGKIYSFQLPTMQEEYRLLEKRIRRALAEGVRPSEIGILYRTHSLEGPLTAYLEACELPYCVAGTKPNVFQHAVAKDILAYLRLSRGCGERADLLRILNRPYRGLSRKALEKKNAGPEALMAYYEGKPRQKAVRELLQGLRAVAALPTAAAIVYIEKRMGYEGYLREEAREKNTEPEGMYRVLETLEMHAMAHREIEEFLSYAENYEVLRREQENRREDTEGIRLMTYHGAKGLEFQVLHLVDVMEGITPYRKAKGEAQMEEERRDFYVALTRAISEVNIYMVQERQGRRYEPSRFVWEAAGVNPCGKRRAGVNS